MFPLLLLLAAGAPGSPAAADLAAGPEVADPAAGAALLPSRREDILIVGDSVTAGMYLMALDDRLAERSWANRLLASFGIPADLPRLDRPAPADYPGVVRDGWGFAAWRYVVSAVPWFLSAEPGFEAGEPRAVVAVPGQTLREVLHQSSKEPGDGSIGWVLGRHLLPQGLTALETAERSAGRPAWVILWIGNNDLLASFGRVGTARPPDPSEFAWHFELAVLRLRVTLRPGLPAGHVLICTLPDVTRIPLWQPLPAGARDEHGRPWPEGSVASAFLLEYRDDRFRRGEEAFDPDALAEVRDRVGAYNRVIREVAERHGCTVVDLGGLMDELAAAPDWNAPDSPWFSPDLHHPAGHTQLALARRIERKMREIARVPGPGIPPAPVPSPAPPANESLTLSERARSLALMRSATLGALEASYPPPLTVAAEIDLGVQAGEARLGDAVLAVQIALERPALPATTRWNSRFFLAGRVSATIRDDRPEVPPEGIEGRLGWSFEPIGAWNRQHYEAGLRWAGVVGLGWWLRGEWRFLYAETAADGWAPSRLEAGVRLGTDSRPGHNGN